MDIEEDLEDTHNIGDDDIKAADGSDNCTERGNAEVFIGKVLFKKDCKPILKCLKMERLGDGNIFMSLFGEISHQGVSLELQISAFL